MVTISPPLRQRPGSPGRLDARGPPCDKAGGHRRKGRAAKRRAYRRTALAALVAMALAWATASGVPTPSANPSRGGTMTVTTEGNPDFLDPGFAYAQDSWQILANTGDGLLAFRRADGRAGA